MNQFHAPDDKKRSIIEFHETAKMIGSIAHISKQEIFSLKCLLMDSQLFKK
jgi:hypothetical protein